MDAFAYSAESAVNRIPAVQFCKKQEIYLYMYQNNKIIIFTFGFLDIVCNRNRNSYMFCTFVYVLFKW